MEKIDRLGWAAGVCCHSYGWRIGVRTNRSDVLPQAWDRLPPGAEPAELPFVDLLYSLRVGGEGHRSGLRNYTLLYKGAQRIARTMDLDEALETLESDLQITIAEFAQDRVFVHAGAVGYNSKALLLPGRSMAGKSTLVVALLRLGATYYSDEYAVLDENGLVHPYARRLSLRQAEQDKSLRLGAEELGGRAGTEALPIGMVALATFRPAAAWKPRRISPAKAILEILDNTVAAQTLPRRVLAYLGRVTPQAVALKGWRGEAAETAELLIRAMEN
jgi:hypothetical protein